MIRPPHNIQCKQHCLIACEQALRGVLRFKNSQLRQEFLNLIIHSCSFLKQYLKIQALTRTLTLVPKLSTLSSDRIRGRTRSGKALNRIYLSWAFFTKHACLRSRNDSYSQFPRSPLRTPGTTASLLCPKINTKKNGLQIMSLAAYASETNEGFQSFKMNIKHENGKTSTSRCREKTPMFLCILPIIKRYAYSFDL